MLTRINDIKCIGSVGNLHSGKGNECSFCRQTVVLADNAVGKTTLGAILKSYGRKDPSLLVARAKLGDTGNPFAVLDFDGDSVRFQDGLWHGNPAKEPNIAIFDQAFINENVFSTEVTSDHLKNIHLIVLGEKGASLNSDLEKAKESERVARRKFKTFQDELEKRKEATGRIDYLDLPANVTEKTVSEEISKHEGSLKATQQKPVIDALQPPSPLEFALGDFTSLREALAKGADTAHEAARARVKNRIEEILCNHQKAESFLQTGMQLRPPDNTCPFCGQSLQHVNNVLADFGLKFTVDGLEHKSSLQSSQISASLRQYDVKEAQRHEHEKRVAELEAFVAGNSTEIETVPLRIRRVLEFVLRLKYCRHLDGERELTALINRLAAVKAITGDVTEKLRYLNKRTQTGCHAEAEQDPVHDLGLEDWKAIVRNALEALDEA